MKRFIASIAGLAAMATTSLAFADCISTCENNCLSLLDPGAIGLCISSCPATCAVPVPACDTTGNANGCSNTSVVVTPQDTAGFRITNDGTGGSAKAFMTLTCQNVTVNRVVFKGSVTVNPGSSTSKGCIFDRRQFGRAFNSTCGRNNTCSGGVN